MIVEYHRPDSIEEALRLLQRETPRTSPMGGGTVLNRPSPEPLAVVDLQNLGLSQIDRRGNSLLVGATATLQSLLDTAGLTPALGRAIRHEATHNMRQSASLAGTLVGAGGRSPLSNVPNRCSSESRRFVNAGQVKTMIKINGLVTTCTPGADPWPKEAAELYITYA